MADKKTDKAFNDWLDEPPPANKSRSCETCRYGDDLNNLVRAYMQRRIDGTTQKRNIDLHRKLKELFNYHLGDSALSRHMRVCEKDLYEKMRATDIELGLARGPSKLDEKLGRKTAQRKG
jgi:hypothetical protein